jgi:APA family basic amino acid/polyamine antiporter
MKLSFLFAAFSMQCFAIMQGAVCVLLLLQSSAFIELLSYFGIASFLFQALTGAALIRLRHSKPDLHRPYSVTFYPLAPLIMICFSLYLVVSTFVSNPLLSSLVLVFIAVSFPVYFLFVCPTPTVHAVNLSLKR